ncbi:uncharacterized protein LOC114930728 [Nylanderia fulva]|uniref:uncharacterized protein LOC114930728 n=1 Tax=Nylanderia fulva TaxID=613905 RepID=UPI0010FB4DAC|nr:uncharacterized protein LOC114930728 [Nylanderia fulva]
MDVIFEEVQTDETKSTINESETQKKTDINIETTDNTDNENFTLINTIVIPSNMEESNFIDFNLQDLLVKAPYGGSILKYYAENNSLNFSLRTKLVNIIARHLYIYMLKHRLTHFQFELITSKILNLFPNECRSTYYIPAIPKNESPTNKAVMARGKLIDKCRNMLYTSNDKLYVRKRKCPSDSSSDEHGEQIFDEDTQSDVSWLKYNYMFLIIIKIHIFLCNLYRHKVLQIAIKE